MLAHPVGAPLASGLTPGFMRAGSGGPHPEIRISPGRATAVSVAEALFRDCSCGYYRGNAQGGRGCGRLAAGDRSRRGRALNAGGGVSLVLVEGFPLQERVREPVQPVPAAAQGGHRLLVAFLDDLAVPL